jgi:hypothetical protein
MKGPLSETPVATVNAIHGALEKAGVEFTNGNQPRRPAKVFGRIDPGRGAQCIE